jgi:hypothetical protein
MNHRYRGPEYDLQQTGLRVGRRVAAGELASDEAVRLVSQAVARSALPAPDARKLIADAVSIGTENFHPVDGVPYVARCLANIQPIPMRWLWSDRLALGKLNLIAGQPGLGKSQITANMAGVISRGGKWPDGTYAPLGSVVFITCEDDPADTIVPRLEAAGADRRRIHLLDWVRDERDESGEAVRSYDIGRDVTALEALCHDIGDVRLIVIDPVSAYVGGIDSHKVSDVRGSLAPLQAMAAELSVCVVMITHLNKGTNDGSAMSRVAGSGAYVAACRSAWFVAPHPQDAEKRIFTPLKNNIGDDKTGFAYRIEGVELGREIATSRVVFDSEHSTSVLTTRSLQLGRMRRTIARWPRPSNSCSTTSKVALRRQGPRLQQLAMPRSPSARCGELGNG